MCNRVKEQRSGRLAFKLGQILKSKLKDTSDHE